MGFKGRINPFGDSSKDFVFFPSLSHKKGVHRIVRGLESNCGLILLTGEIGVGKTSLARHIQTYLLDRFIFVELGNPYQTPLEQVFYCCEKFGLDTAGLSTIHDCVGRLEQHFHELIKGGRRPVIFFDESHLLTKRHLNLVHILSNLMANDGPLVQILLVGQLEMLDLLDSEGMEALNQRIGVRCQLAPLHLEDTDKYIRFKLEKSGQSSLMRFSRGAVERVWKESNGLPRLINHVCAHALDSLTFKGTQVVTPEVVDEVCQDSVYTGMFKAKSEKRKNRNRRIVILGVALSVVLSVSVAVVFSEVSLPRFMKHIVNFVVSEQEMDSLEIDSESDSVSKSLPWQFRDIVVQPGELNESDFAADNVEEGDKETSSEVTIANEPALSSEQGLKVSESGDSYKFLRNVPNPEAVQDGSTHPIIGQLVVGAIAWNENPTLSFAVVNSTLLREGEQVDGATLLNIDQSQLVFEFRGEYFRLIFSRQPDEG